MDRTSIPDAVSAEVRGFITKEWREVLVGGTSDSSRVLPTFISYVNEREVARGIGNDILRLSQGRVDAITLRMDPLDQLTAFPIGGLAEGDLDIYGLPNLSGVVLRRTLRPTQGLLTAFVWSE